MRTYNNIIIILIIALLPINLSCERHESREISNSDFIGTWNPKHHSKGVAKSCELILKEGSIAILSNVNSVVLGTYDTMQINNGAYYWRLSFVGNDKILDIYSNEKTISLSFNILNNGRVELRPTYEFDMSDDDVPIFIRK